MNDQEWYEYGQEHCGIGVGDKVKVLRRAKTEEMGWEAQWQPEMDGYVGGTFKVFDILHNRYDLGNFWFPFFVLELIEKAPAKPELPPKIMEIISQGDFGGKNEAVIRLVAKILEEVKNDARNE